MLQRDSKPAEFVPRAERGRTFALNPPLRRQTNNGAEPNAGLRPRRITFVPAAAFPGRVGPVMSTSLVPLLFVTVAILSVFAFAADASAD